MPELDRAQQPIKNIVLSDDHYHGGLYITAIQVALTGFDPSLLTVEQVSWLPAQIEVQIYINDPEFANKVALHLFEKLGLRYEIRFEPSLLERPQQVTTQLTATIQDLIKRRP